MVRTTQPVHLPQPFQQPEPRGLGEGLKSCLSIAEDAVTAGLQGGRLPELLHVAVQRRMGPLLEKFNSICYHMSSHQGLSFS